MPSFQPIELFWQHGKQYVSFNYKTGRKMVEVWEQVRKGWYGDAEWGGQEGGWKPADCGKLVEHAIKEMDRWVENDAVLSGSMRQLDVSKYCADDSGKKDSAEGEDMEEQIDEEQSVGLIDSEGFDADAPVM